MFYTFQSVTQTGRMAFTYSADKRHSGLYTVVDINKNTNIEKAPDWNF